MGLGLACCNALLFLLLLGAHRSGARKLTEKHWEELDHDHQKEMPRTEYFWVYDVPKGHTILKALWVYDGRYRKDGVDVRSRVQSQQHAMDDHQRIHARQGHVAHQDMRTNEVHAHPSSHMDHIEQSKKVFFTMEDLKIGKVIPTSLPMTDPSTSPHFLPREEADSIPFSLKQLPYLLDFFSFSHDSPQAKAMEDALKMCEIDPIKGETKLCATSLESMLDFARSIFGLETDFHVLSTTHLTKSTTSFQNFTILEVPKEMPSDKMVACHSMPYPYAVFYCHSQENENKIFSVSLGAEDGDRVEAVAVCHMDTSQWSPDHVSFRFLGTKPGSHVCHFFPTDNLVFLPKST